MASLLNIVIPPLSKPLVYEIPESLADSIQVGFRVEVPLGKRLANGFVISKQQGDPKDFSFEIKKIEKIKSSYPFFIPQQIKFFDWVAQYYGTDISSVIDVAIPPWVVDKFRKTVLLAKETEEAFRGKLEIQLIELLKQNSGILDYSFLLRRLKGSGPVIKRLTVKGVLRIESHELFDHYRATQKAPAWAKTDVELNTSQAAALQLINERITSRSFKSFLLHGVTGSGKTEVYFEAIRHALSLGLGALIIVPEIALTPQLIDRFRARLGDDVAILHSALQKRARWDAWRALLDNRCHVAIGARSGIFAPIHPLGILIVDEEHDGSYKQSEGLRYNARDLAVVRASQENCPVVLGSATPSLETWHNALSGKYKLISLPSRPQSMAKVELRLVDLNQHKPWQMPSKNISPVLRDALSDTLSKGEQAFILYNKRGFAAYLQCERCDTVIKCPNCSVVLTYHRSNHSLLCHYCSLSLVPPELCQECTSTDTNRTHLLTINENKDPRLVQRGAGTEKVFDELAALFPSARLDRLDRDVADDIETYRKVLDGIRSGQTSILVGTQMIAKGHDLPGVTLVGVVDCDIGLHLPDFRSGERVFQLLTQAAGRAGRGSKMGKVILQTRVPKHPSLFFTLVGDFPGFAAQELRDRQSMSYPPFSRILRVIASSADKNLPPSILRECKNVVLQIAAAQGFELRLLGPSPAPIEKVKTQWRYHLLIKSKNVAPLNLIVQSLSSLQGSSKRYRLIFDVDPQDMM